METTLIPIGRQEHRLVKIAAARNGVTIYQFLSELVNSRLAPRKKTPKEGAGK